MLKYAVSAIVLLCACGAPDAEDGVDAALQRVSTDLYRLTLSNHTNSDACFPQFRYPSDGHVIAFRVFGPDGREKPGPIYEPVMGPLPAQRLAARSRDTAEFEFAQGVASGDCVLLQLFFRDCVEQDEFSVEEGIENPTVLQIAWSIENGSVRDQPDLAHSCVPRDALFPPLE